MIELELPYAPTLNHFKRPGRIIRTKGGKTFQQRITTPETKAFYMHVWQAVVAMRAHKGLQSFGDSLLEMEIDVYPPDKRRRDIDNLAKSVLDALQKAGLYDDDYQICRLVIQRMDIFPKGRIVVRIKARECPYFCAGEKCVDDNS